MSIIHDFDVAINSLNKNTKLNLAIDTIRCNFYKNGNAPNLNANKINALKTIAENYGYKWRKLNKKNDDFIKIYKRYHYDKKLDLTNIYTLTDNEKILPIYYANTTNGNRHKSRLEIYALKQYDREKPDYELINKLLSVVNTITSIDLCFDFKEPLNIDKLKKNFNFREYGETSPTVYFDLELYNLVQRFYIYDKQLKDNLKYPLYRIETEIMLNLKRLCNSNIKTLDGKIMAIYDLLEPVISALKN